MPAFLNAKFSFIFKHLSWFEDEYIFIACFTTSSNLLFIFFNNLANFSLFEHKNKPLRIFAEV